MDIKECTSLLAGSSETNRSKYIPWWDADLEDNRLRYDLFSQEEIHNIEECAAEWTAEMLNEPAGSSGFTRFQLLVWLNFQGAVTKILQREDAGQIVNQADGKGNGITALMLACCRGNKAMAGLLLENGADASLCDAEGKNAYHYLARTNAEGLSACFASLTKCLGQRREIARVLSGDINQKDKEGMTPLADLLHRGNSNMSWALTEVFLEKGADTGYVDENGNTLLMTAISKDHRTAALQLMEDPAMVNQENKEGKTPMDLAASRRNDALCMALKDHGALQEADIEAARMDMNNFSRITSNAFADFSEERRDPLSTALYLAQKLLDRVDPDDDDDMKSLSGIFYNALRQDEDCRVLDLCREADIEFDALIYTSGGVTCLRDECLSGNYGVKVIKKFLEFGVDMDEAVIKGRTPANIVASLQPRMMFFGGKDDYFEQAAQFFSKESMEQADDNGTTALHAAARNGHAEMLKVMIEKGVDVNLTEDEPAEAGNTPLHAACIYGKAEVVRLLKEHGADDSMQNVAGETPAHHAVMKKKFGGDLNTEERKAVLKELEHLDTARNDGKTPLMMLQYLDLNTTAELLPVFLEKGVDVNKTDMNGNTALLLNTDNQCYKEVVKGLVKAGADVNAANQAGDTPLLKALAYGSQDVARFLIKKGADYNHANNRGVTPAQLAVEKGYDTILGLMENL